MTELGLERSVVMVTGAGGGIGLAICQEFAKAAVERIIAVDCDQEALSALEKADKASDLVEVHVADVADEIEVRELIGEIERRHGRIDVLINAASIAGRVATIRDCPSEVFDRTMAVNVRSVFLMMKYALPGMVARRKGCVINFGSTASFRGPPGLGPYSASKHAVMGLTRSAASEVAEFGVRVNALCPGPTDTRMMRAIERESAPESPEKAREAWRASIPRRQYATPGEIASVAVLLASPRMINVTGAALLADGGLTAL